MALDPRLTRLIAPLNSVQYYPGSLDSPTATPLILSPRLDRRVWIAAGVTRKTPSRRKSPRVRDSSIPARIVRLHPPPPRHAPRGSGQSIHRGQLKRRS